MKDVAEMTKLFKEKYVAKQHPYTDWVRQLFSEYMTFYEAAGIRPAWDTEESWPTPKERSTGNYLKDMKRRSVLAWQHRSDRTRMERLVVEIQGLIWMMGDEPFLRKVWEISWDGDPSKKLRVICEEYGFSIPEGEGK